jgi:hypothetical protein
VRKQRTDTIKLVIGESRDATPEEAEQIAQLLASWWIREYEAKKAETRTHSLPGNPHKRT